jgi:putative tryptophan/tyrosine transport system substrate-binding protein
MQRREFIAGLGSAAAWRASAHAQQGGRMRVGVLMPLAEADPEGRARQAMLEKGLKEIGYVDGQNVTIDFRWVAAQYDRLPMLAADLVHRQVDVIVTPGSTLAALAAKAATATIPIVFSIAADPIRTGLVASINRPGGNITGVSYLNSQLGTKRLELLRELVRGVDLVAVLMDPSQPPAEIDLRDVKIAADKIGQRIRILKASTSVDIDAAFAAITEEPAGALMVISSSFFTSRRAQIITLAAQRAVPVIFPSRDYIDSGGLMSYSASLRDAYRLVGTYVGRILRGEKPADLPVQQSTKIELVINLKTAQTLGLTIPPLLLATADEVIE